MYILNIYKFFFINLQLFKNTAMRLKIYIIINLLLSISFFNAQRFPNHNKYFIFLDAKTKDIKITENDSIIYTNNFQNPKKIKKIIFQNFLIFINISLLSTTKIILLIVAEA